MITVSTADSLLKNVYLNLIADQLNNKTNPFYSAIEKTSLDVQGNKAIIPVLNGMNGGVACSSENGGLPLATNAAYKNLSAQMVNMYGVLEITDKALRAGRSSENALISLLETEMSVLLDSCKFNFSRMLWQNGKGVISKVGVQVQGQALNKLVVKSVKNLKVGMVFDIVSATNGGLVIGGLIINDIDVATKTLTLKVSLPSTLTLTEDDYITIQNSYGNEILGIPYLYDNTLTDFYGNIRTGMKNFKPTSIALNGALTLTAIQNLLDEVEAYSNDTPNLLVSGFETRRAYINLLATNRSNIDYMNLDGGFKALSFNGIPFYADKFCPETDTLHALNTDGFKLVQLCDWEWLESDNGKILYQLEEKPCYSATLVKYANLICYKPTSQGRLTNIQ